MRVLCGAPLPRQRGVGGCHKHVPARLRSRSKGGPQTEPSNRYLPCGLAPASQLSRRMLRQVYAAIVQRPLIGSPTPPAPVKLFAEAPRLGLSDVGSTATM